jgi:hypothetical protein
VAIMSDAARLSLVVAPLVHGRLNGHALLVPNGLAVSEHLQAVGVSRVPEKFSPMTRLSETPPLAPVEDD